MFPADALYVLDENTTHVVSGVEGAPIRFDQSLSPKKVALWRASIGAIAIGANDDITDPAPFHGILPIAPVLREALRRELFEKVVLPSDLEQLETRALATASPSWLHAERAQLIGKPGGFPLREPWGGRRYIRASCGRRDRLLPIKTEAGQPLLPRRVRAALADWARRVAETFRA